VRERTTKPIRDRNNPERVRERTTEPILERNNPEGTLKPENALKIIVADKKVELNKKD
jgi:hypothetical protein